MRYAFKGKSEPEVGKRAAEVIPAAGKDRRDLEKVVPLPRRLHFVSGLRYVHFVDIAIRVLLG